MQIEKNVEYVGKKRDGVSFSPKDISAAASFLEVSFLSLCSHSLSKFDYFLSCLRHYSLLGLLRFRRKRRLVPVLCLNMLLPCSCELHSGKLLFILPGLSLFQSLCMCNEGAFVKMAMCSFEFERARMAKMMHVYSRGAMLQCGGGWRKGPC